MIRLGFPCGLLLYVPLGVSNVLCVFVFVFLLFIFALCGMHASVMRDGARRFPEGEMITRLFPLLVANPLCVDMDGAPISYESYEFSPRQVRCCCRHAYRCHSLSALTVLLCETLRLLHPRIPNGIGWRPEYMR